MNGLRPVWSDEFSATLASLEAMPTTKDVLVRTLDGLRSQIFNALDGLTEKQLRQSALPSRWNALGLVKHLTFSDEHYWFDHVCGGNPLAFPEGPNADWHVPPDVPPASVLSAYQASIDTSNAVIAAMDVSAPPRQPDPTWQEWGMSFPDLQTILLHVIAETARHAGQLDAHRELIDGHQWCVL